MSWRMCVVLVSGSLFCCCVNSPQHKNNHHTTTCYPTTYLTCRTPTKNLQTRIMVITEEVPGAYPVSDWSASSSSAEGAEEFVRSSRPLHARLRFNSDATSSSIPGVVLETSLCCQDTEPSSPMPHDRSQKHVTFGNLEVRKYPVILGGKMRSLPKMQNFSLWYVLYS